MYEYKSVLGVFRRRKTTNSIKFNANNATKSTTINVEETVVIEFVPSFLSRCILLKYTNRCGFVSRSFRTYPVLPFDHPLWEMCYTGDMRGLRESFGNETLLPYAVDLFGRTPLHVR